MRASAATPAPAAVTVGIVNAVSDVPIFIAEKKGFFADEGLTVTTKAFPSAANMVAPLGAGQLDIGAGSVSAGLYNAVGRGIKLRVVADKASSQPGYGVNELLVAVIDIITESTAVKDQTLLRTITPNGCDPNGRVNVASLQHDLDFYREHGYLDSAVTVDQVVDNSFVEAALKSLGRYRPKAGAGN
jgi:ABC-type nitrate/sulfonate/bicarbonate transport system substrate-binding protein